MLNLIFSIFSKFPEENSGIPLFILLKMCGMYVSLFVNLYELSEEGQYNVQNV